VDDCFKIIKIFSDGVHKKIVFIDSFFREKFTNFSNSRAHEISCIKLKKPQQLNLK